MTDLDNQTSYWDAVATTKRFTHPLHAPWTATVRRDAAILDYGCGYGRTMADLAELGFTDLTGVDSSAGMIGAARTQHPTMRFEVVDAPPALPFADASFDLAVLFAVLTCIPGDTAQRRLIDELGRTLKPGGLLYVSDLLLGDDARSRERYDRFAAAHGAYGVFETSDGAVCRHHRAEHFATLLDAFEVQDSRRIGVATMNGNAAAGIQVLVRKLAAG
ncbi:class I SAM-dependent methyltransferase [Catenulispora sp. NL8]|uniref:Class I SAM-dependent methyltransferase n=1 Tax=Catenulispora pinistramenti TaxID=2705254 RepID=A0ABS5L723_9ACTN|nr:class I SAM-dependent methyltransferase [Catenulispora pinistramenti]MBS2554121.1 class I SAM-dependent methyltransferase [Catenulispora pinistramenti]